MVLGAALTAASLILFLFNVRQQEQAADAAAEVMPKLVEAITQRAEAETAPLPAYDPQRTMHVVEIDGRSYAGFLAIPALALELPILAQWDYPSLQIAPCRYWGDMYSEDLVVMAHNYPKHFGRLSELKAGDLVTVTDMDSVTWEYQVAAVEVLPAHATEEMLSQEFALTLFTCTYGGENRVTVRCDRIRN